MDHRIDQTTRRWLAALLVVLAVPLDAAAAPIRAAVFEFELIDTSLEGAAGGVQAAEQQRLVRLGEQLRQTLAATDRYVLVELAPAREAIDAARRQRDCPQCAVRIARALDADVAITGTVQKVSNLILNINLHEWDAATGELRRGMSVDIRGNTDETWSRGLSHLLRRFLAPPRGGG